MTEFSVLFDQALQLRGDAYLTVERELREQSRQAGETLAQFVNSPDPIGRLLATVLIDWQGARGQEYEAALRYLYETVPAHIEGTPMIAPPCDSVALYLQQNFENRVTSLLTLRLLMDLWPRWRVIAVLLYLREQGDAPCTEGLIRFVVERDEAQWRTWAGKSLQAIEDPTLEEKLLLERKRCRKLKLVFPDALNNLIP